jgi:hypothetical protein
MKLPFEGSYLQSPLLLQKPENPVNSIFENVTVEPLKFVNPA